MSKSARAVRAILTLRDARVDTPRAMLEVCRVAEGQRAGQFQPLADARRTDACDDVVSPESACHPGNGDFEAGFRLCIARFKATFG